MGNSSGQRFNTSSNGLGDIRLMGYYNFLTSKQNSRLTVGLGTKLPTGNYNYKDIFQTNSGPELRAVDQSIQPGDGGVGIILETNYLVRFGMMWSGYANGLYMANPRNTNGTMPRNSELSVADQFLGRLGAQYQTGSFLIGFGGRAEGIPAYDLIGGSDGFRRPGYIISLEPSLTYITGNHVFNINVPFAVERNRTQSASDKQRQLDTGVATHGDAAFADYLISVGYAFRLNKKGSAPFGTGSEIVK
jgi:hypothetical protein